MTQDIKNEKTFLFNYFLDIIFQNTLSLSLNVRVKVLIYKVLRVLRGWGGITSKLCSRSIGSIFFSSFLMTVGATEGGDYFVRFGFNLVTLGHSWSQ